MSKKATQSYFVRDGGMVSVNTAGEIELAIETHDGSMLFAKLHPGKTCEFTFTPAAGPRTKAAA